MKKNGYFNPVLKLKIKSRLELILLVNQVNNLIFRESRNLFVENNLSTFQESGIDRHDSCAITHRRLLFGRWRIRN